MGNSTSNIKGYSPYSLNIAFSSIPTDSSKKYIADIDNAIAEYYRKTNEYFNSDNDIESQPRFLKYFILGDYDIAYLSLQSNHKFSQKLFTPNYTGEIIHEPGTFQVISGICPIIEDLDLEKFYNELYEVDNRKKYVSICNLKLNNKLLIGNGEIFLHAVVNLLHQRVKKTNYYSDIKFLIQQSFSWFELSLVLFTDSSEIISDFISMVRRLTIKDIENIELRNRIFNNSLYTFKKESNLNKNNPHIFADTHTHIGIEYNMAINPDSHQKFENDKLVSIIEWEIKPVT